MAQWYYVDKNQQRVGPMDANVLIDALRHGQVTAHNMVWQEGMPAWQPLSNNFDALGVPESLRIRPKAKKSMSAWLIVLGVMALLSILVLGIMLAIALPAYQDFTIRAKVGEALGLASAAKLATSETRFMTEKWPNNNHEAGYTSPSSDLVSEITISSAQDIRITFSTSQPELSGKTLMLRADIGPDGMVVWECNAEGSNKLNGAAGTLPAKYAPASCRP